MGIEIERALLEENKNQTSLPLLSLNHVSFVCKSVMNSVKFYTEVLGFVLIKRPSSFKFEGAWLFRNGIGIHLLECNRPEDMPKKKEFINPKDNHISFQCTDMRLFMRKLEEMGIEYVIAQVEEGGIKVDQLFFHDPDGYMVEICNCDNLPVLPLSSCPLKNLTCPQEHYDNLPNLYRGDDGQEIRCAAKLESLMMESLVTDIMDISL